MYYLNHLRALFVLLFLAVLVSCVAIPSYAASKAPPQKIVVPVDPKPETPAPVLDLAPLAWEKDHPERATWSRILREEVARKLASFKKASDANLYCAKFAGLNDTQKIEVFSTMAVAIALYESGYNPKSINPDDVAGTASIGLYQLSYEDQMKWCAMDKKKSNLTDPLVNIQCAIPEMARLIEKDGVIAAGQLKFLRRGLARYWAVTWPKNNLYDIRKKVQALPFCK